MFFELRHGHPTGGRPIAAHVGLDESFVHVDLPRQQAQVQQFLIQTVKDFCEAFSPHAVNEVSDAGVDEHRTVDGLEVKASERGIW